MRLGKTSDNKKKRIGQLRRSQLVTTFGSGALTDLPDYSIILAATDYWSDHSPKIYEPNLQKLLKIKYFKQPLVSEDNDGNPYPSIPAFRFPVMHFCQSCGRLMPYWGFTKESEGKKCSKCKKKIVPSRFVAACTNGHIEDFPYDWWVHKGVFNKCPEHSDGKKSKHDNLTIEFKTKSGGNDSIIIKCNACGAERSMAGCMSVGALKGYTCRGHRPWIGLKKDHNDTRQCNCSEMRVLQRGASNVYFSVTSSALTIPPWSNKIQKYIEDKEEILKPIIATLGISDAIDNILYSEAYFKKLIDNDICSLKELKEQIKRRFEANENDDETYTEQKLMEDEYAVLCRGNYNDDLFKAEKTESSEFLKDYFEDVVLVKRLREVLALQGFRRIISDFSKMDKEKFKEYNNGKEYVQLSKEKQEWLPAIELLGEGIFIKINEEKLQEWEVRNKDRYDEMERRLGDKTTGRGKFSTRYVMLHTLSHLLIRQLAIQSGYAEASIKERIYSTYNDSKKSMAGILIYTSSSDSDGSLGGLVRQGRAEYLENIVRGMLQEAVWCSSDPICTESKAQGFESLNYAACHACTLLPETSCEAFNCLLDRCSIIGTLEDEKIGFLRKLLD